MSSCFLEWLLFCPPSSKVWEVYGSIFWPTLGPSILWILELCNDFPFLVFLRFLDDFHMDILYFLCVCSNIYLYRLFNFLLLTCGLLVYFGHKLFTVHMYGSRFQWFTSCLFIGFTVTWKRTFSLWNVQFFIFQFYGWWWNP